MTTKTEAPAEDELDRKLKEPKAESYRFTTAGELVKGTVARLDLAATDYGECKIVVLDTGEEALRSIWLFHDALLSQMEKLKPQVGDRIAILYEGKIQSPSTGRFYHSYRVVSDRDRPGFTWGGGAALEHGGEENPYGQPADDPGF